MHYSPVRITRNRQTPRGETASFAALFAEAEPECITILPTYRCNAACRECCFESNPTIKHRMSREQLLELIRRVPQDFPNARYIVLSGGEVTLLREDLFEALLLIKELGLGSRIVTNAHWAKTEAEAARWVKRFVECGLSELNVSTGDEHAEWVPLDRVALAIDASTRQHLLTLLVVEGQDDAHITAKTLATHPLVAKVLSNDAQRHWFILMTNIWMPFHEDARITGKKSDAGEKGCDNIFENFVVNPYGHLMSCCGLTMEYIPELKVGNASADSLRQVYNKQFGDLLKLWIWLDGTEFMLAKLNSLLVEPIATHSHHPCAICAHIFQSPALRRAADAHVAANAENILFRAAIKARMSARIPDKRPEPPAGHIPQPT